MKKVHNPEMPHGTLIGVQPLNGFRTVPSHGVNTRPLFWMVLATALAQAVFAARPDIDLRIAALFFDPDHGFWMNRDPGLNILRDGLRAIVWLVFFPALALSIMARFRNRPLRLGIRPWVFACACLSLGPGLLVNVILKDHWGRARPADIVEFGGAAHFTPAFQISNQCARNCSFTSGEAASAGMSALVLLVLLWPRAPRGTRIALALGLGTVVLVTSGLRIMMGRHFLSDVTFSLLFCALITACLYCLLDMRGFVGVTALDLRADIRTIFSSGEGDATAKTTTSIYIKNG